MKIHPMIKEVLWLTLLFLICAFSACVKAEGGLVKVVADMTVCTNPMFCQQQTSYGSGVVVGTFNNQSIVLTAGHVFQGHDRQGLPVDAQLRRVLVNGHKSKKVASWVTSDPPCDFAIVLVEHNFGQVSPLSDVPPKEGDKVCISGFDFAARDTPKLIVNQGTITSVKKGEFTEVDFSSASGISGGPVVDKAGNVKGLLVHTAGIMPNFDFRKSILHYMRDADLPPPNPIRYERKVPDPRPDPQFSKEALLQAEIDKLKKEKATWKATESDASDTGKQLPPTEDTSQQAGSGDSTGSGETTPDSTSKPSLGSRAATAAGKGLDAVQVGLSFADKALSNPLVIAALAATGVGSSLVGAKAGISLGNSAMAWLRRRKKKKGGVVGEVPADTPPPFAKPVPKQPAPQIDSRVDDIIDFLKSRDEKVDVEKIAQEVSGLLVTQELQADGKTTEETLWKDGVRLAKEGALQLNVLGGKQVAQSIEDFVYRKKSEQDGTTL